MWAGIISVIGALLGLWLLYARRKETPSIEQRIDDLDNEYLNVISKVHELRAQGDHAGADAILRRLTCRTVGGGVLYDPAQSHLLADTRWKRMGIFTPEGKLYPLEGTSTTPSDSNK